jgi:hypothetical protein
LGKTAQICCIYTCVKIALLRPDPAHDVDPEISLCIFMSVIFCFDTGAGQIAAPGPYVILFRSRMRSRKRGWKHNFVAEPHYDMRHPQHILHCDFWDLEFFNCNFYFILCLAYALVIILYFASFTSFIATFIIYVHVCLPRRFFILFNFFNQNLNQSYSTVFFNSGAVSYGSNCSSAVIFNIYSITFVHSAPDSNFDF